jgi:hypothetical protein
LTATTWSDRLLATNSMFEGENRALWLCTGNNLQLDGDLSRRSVWIRLDAYMDRPWERASFKHDPLMVWVKKNRHELLRALIVLCKHWIASGRPRFTAATLGSFEDWCGVVGGIVTAAGFAGFLGNRDEMFERLDSASQEWRTLVAAWWEAFSSKPQGVAGLYVLVKDRDLVPSVFKGSADTASERSLKTKLGTALRAQRDRRYGDLIIRHAGTNQRTSASLYALEAAEPSRNDERGYAEVQQAEGPSPDSVAEPAEPTEPVSPPYAGDEKSHLPDADDVQEGRGRLEVTEVQQVPQPDSQQALFSAEPPAEPGAREALGEGEVTQVAGADGLAVTCPACGLRPTLEGRLCFRCEG